MKSEMQRKATMAKSFQKDINRILSDYTAEQIISDERFLKMLREYVTDAPQAAGLIGVVNKLEDGIILLKEEHKPLVKAVIGVNWLQMGSEVIEAYTAFIPNLVYAHMDYLQPLLHDFVRKMRGECQPPKGDNKDKKKKPVELDFSPLHNLLRSFSQLIPMTSLSLLPILEQVFPFINKDVVVFENYVSNLLKITWYLPDVRMNILDMIVKRMLNLDVRISRDALSEICANEEEGEDMEDEEIFPMDENCNKQEAKSQVAKKEYEKKLQTLLPQAASLDAILNTVMNFIKETCLPGGVLNWPATKTLYREFLSSFDKYVFQTHLSNHTPFLMFYCCSFNKPLVDGFVDYLWKKVTNPMTQPIFRQIASCYIGSFIARANYISISTAKTVMELMMQWVHTYLDQTVDVNRHAGIERHSAFYSVCQACFYIFCFKHTEFWNTKRGDKWAEALNFQRVVTSSLNPLKFCLPLIANTFSSATRTYQLAFCDTIIERNNRYSLPVYSGNAFDGRVDQQLHSFFPFDPYLLKKSSPFITPLYQTFQGSVQENNVDSEEEDDDFLPEACHLKPCEDKSAVDLLQYSCSPGFQHADLMASL